MKLKKFKDIYLNRRTLGILDKYLVDLSINHIMLLFPYFLFLVSAGWTIVLIAFLQFQLIPLAIYTMSVFGMVTGIAFYLTGGYDKFIKEVNGE